MRRFPHLSGSDWLVASLLTLVLLAGGYLRFVGQNWDDFTHPHPDERFLTGVVSAMGGGLNFTGDDLEGQFATCLERYPQTGGVGGFFDAQCSTLNPHNVGYGLMVYGTLPTFMVRAAADLTVDLSGDSIWGGYNGVHLVGRTLSALAEMGVILTVFFIGRRLHDKWVGLLAAALYAFTVFSIQQAHFWTVDAMSNLFVVLAIWFAVRVQDDGKLADYLGFGLFFGAALASRINTAPLVGLLLLVAGLRLLPLFDRNLVRYERKRLLTRTFAGLVAAGIVTVVVFRLANPYAFAGPGLFGLSINPRWLDDLGTARHLVSGEAESPPNWQWVGRTGYLFPWSNMVLWGMGIVYGLFAWASWVWAGWRAARGKSGGLRNLLLVVWILGYFGWLGSNWVTSMRYFLSLYPVLALLAAWALVELVRRADRSTIAWRKLAARAALAGVLGFAVLWAVMFTNIYRHLFTTVEASHWIWEQVPGDFAMQIEGAPDGTPLINIAVANGFLSDSTPLELQASRYDSGNLFGQLFTVPADGMVRTVHIPHLGDPSDDSDTETLRIIIKSPESTLTFTEGEVTANFSRANHILGDAYDITLNPPLEVKAGETYQFNVEVSGGPVITAGGVFAWEGDWDEPAPTKVCQFPDAVTLADAPPPGLVGARDCNGLDIWASLINGYKLQVFWEDTPAKRDYFATVLDDSDYLIIGSNRRYDSQSRNANRWPMTMRYYDALFSGELGFELVETFQETFELGPLQVSDQYLPTYSGPDWLNEFEAEEAFHVYDHPVVFIFHKTDAYSSANTRSILDSVVLNQPSIVNNYSYVSPDIVGVVPLYSLPVDAAPTELQFTPEQAETQYDNGTWSSRFHSESIINTQPVITILGWWLAILVIGWAAWPLLFALLPMLGDRGYGFSKIVGLLLTGWLAWLVSSARIPLWSQSGLLLCLLLLAGVSLLVSWRLRGQLADYLQSHWRRLFWIEVTTLVLFIAFLLIRLMNPDLWHPFFGGEKPMDFAYFNGVLRSTIFPPIDPWFTGGYINYYYFGYVVVGVPVLLLGVLPSIAYNLIIPTLFALAGIGAFSVAFNVADSARTRMTDVSAVETESESKPKFRRLGNPWVAGFAALVMAVVLGNLDTPRVLIVEGLARTGYYGQPFSVQQELTQDYIQEYGIQPEGADLVQITEQAASEADSIWPSVLRGLSKVASGEPLNIASNRWYWAPTRILSEPPVSSGGAIVEMPFFTFLYGDLHAHMISMPMMFFVMAFIFHEVIIAGRDKRRRSISVLALALGALSVGMLRGTNTWDWITFMVLSIAGLSFAWWLHWRYFSRRSLLALVGKLGGFAVFSIVFSLPYLTWYAAIYNSIQTWDGPRTPLWAYFTIHGVFLFFIVSLLAWDTSRWLRTVYVRSLRGTWRLLLATLIGVSALLIGLVILATADYPVVLVAVPLLLWVVLLFFRTGQTREMQYLLALAGLSIGLTLGVEFIVLAGDVGRQNTVFKFYIQVWLMFSVVAGVAVAWLFRSMPRWSGGLRTGWTLAAGVLVAIAAIYPITATRGRALDRMTPDPPQTLNDIPLTLDGMDFMKYATLYEGDPDVIELNPDVAPFPLADDYTMIRWLQENIQGSPTIMEGQSDREYRWQSRVAIYTGLPSIIGWNFHQRQQRTFDPLPTLVHQRMSNVNAFYRLPEIQQAWDIIQHYRVAYVVVSSLERAYYPPEGLAKFERMVTLGLLEVVYQQGDAVVYGVNANAVYSADRAADYRDS